MARNKRYRIYNKDVIKWAEKYSDEKFHALLCDAPYHLTTITKRFGKDGSAPAKFGKDGAFQRVGKGFMGQEWDGGDISFRPETWAALGEHLYPGAFGMTFGGSRTAHRIAVAIEDAGFIIHPMIVWVYGSGFPKATRIDTQVDSMLGLKRKKGKLIKNGHGADPLKMSLRRQGDTGVGHWDGKHKEYYESLPASDMSQAWVGHRYGMQALKPAAEPIIVFSKSEDECYNSLKVELDKTNILLEELWNSLAKSQKEIDSAGHGVNMILSRVLNLQDQTLRVSGSTVDGVGKQHTKHQELSNGTAVKEEDTARKNVTKRTLKEKQKEYVRSAKRNSMLKTPSTKVGIAVGSAPTLQEKDLCWKTPLEMGIGTDILADTLQSNLVKAKLDLSMIWLWRLILVDLYEVGSKSTIEMAKKMTTELAILNYSLHKLTQGNLDTLLGKSLSGELWYAVQDVVRNFIGLSTYRVELERSVQSVTSPIIVFQKPYDDKPVDNIVRTGAGALNIDAGRIGYEEGGTLASNPSLRSHINAGNGGHIISHEDKRRVVIPNKNGRWPANFVIDDSVSSVLDAQSGITKGHIGANGYWGFQSEKGWNQNSVPYKSDGYEQVSDEGGASRYFYNVQTQLDMADPFLYVKKAGNKEREDGLFGIVPCVKCGRIGTRTHINDEGKEEKCIVSDHPTVKPIDLNRYLASILLPPDGYAPRRLLVPFSGVSSEMIGGLLAGWEYVEGIELGKHYCELGEKRIKYWLKQ